MGQVSFGTNAYQTASPMFRGNANFQARKNGLVRFGDGDAATDQTPEITGVAPAQPAAPVAAPAQQGKLPTKFLLDAGLTLALGSLLDTVELPFIIAGSFIPAILLSFLAPDTHRDEQGHLIIDSEKTKKRLEMLFIKPIELLPIPGKQRIIAGIRRRGELLLEYNKLTQKFLEGGDGTLKIFGMEPKFPGSKFISRYIHTTKLFLLPFALILIGKIGLFARLFGRAGAALAEGLGKFGLAPLAEKGMVGSVIKATTGEAGRMPVLGGMAGFAIGEEVFGALRILASGKAPHEAIDGMAGHALDRASGWLGMGPFSSAITSAPPAAPPAS